MSASRVSWASRWARLRMSFASRRASVKRGEALRFGLFAIATCLFGVAQPGLEPLPTIAQHLRDRLQREQVEEREEDEEVERRDQDPEEVDRQTGALAVVSANRGPTAPPAPPLPTLAKRSIMRGQSRSCYLMKIARMPTTIASTPSPSANAAPRSQVARIERRGLRVATDRGRGEAGHDAEADAGADDPEGRETCAEMFHLCCSSLVPGAGAPERLLTDNGECRGDGGE